MKFYVICCLFGVVLAEPPRFRSSRFRLQRQELAPTTTESPTESTTDAAEEAPYPPAGGPYPPSGWKPAQPFTLPQEQVPSDMYGAPQKEQPSDAYGAPQMAPSDAYGAPQQSGPYPPSGWKPQGQAFTLPKQQAPPATSYGVPDNTYGPPDNENVEPITDNPQAEKLDGPVEVQKSVGTYYILLPSGQLQKVMFATENDVQNMAYSARLRVVERAPLFFFRP
ncbi:hypothetical protein EVAR_42847_1 [Eumeta japonica]|uniref:DUF4794 domain-containing protein n=1 Tax=Eumeta variegata TaxID=151549 RepID=A0A4C1WFF4_EUMVA|nr:hypothetical protein EVAR_42847_1 [Eumeta japonica]